VVAILQIIFLSVSILAILIGGISFIVRTFMKLIINVEVLKEKINTLDKSIKEISQKLNKMMEFNMFWIHENLPSASKIIESKNNPLTKEEIELRNRLLRKLQNKTITKEEALKLKEIIEKEKIEAEKKNDTSLLWAIGIVLGAIFLYLLFKED